VTNGEFLLSLVEKLMSNVDWANDQGRRKSAEQDHADVMRLEQIAEQMLKDEKYPAVRP
jgi:hypothetical protein